MIYPVKYAIVPGPAGTFDIVRNTYTPEETFLMEQTVLKRYKTLKWAEKALAKYL